MFRTPAPVAFLLCLVLGALAGCSVLQAEPPVQTHELAPRIERAGQRKPGPTTLYVSPIEAMAPYATSQMAYRQRPYELNYFARNAWAAEPARLIEPWLIASLEEANVFASVVSGVSAPPTDLRLDIELIALRHEFDTSPSQVRLLVRAQLIDLASRAVLSTRRLEAVEPAASADAYGGVAATNRALESVLSQITEFCVAFAQP